MALLYITTDSFLAPFDLVILELGVIIEITIRWWQSIVQISKFIPEYWRLFSWSIQIMNASQDAFILDPIVLG
jgi:hypothetical protein